MLNSNLGSVTEWTFGEREEGLQAQTKTCYYLNSLVIKILEVVCEFP